MNQWPEHRKYPRMAVDCGIDWRHADSSGTGAGIARNISGNGVLFIAADRPAVGERLEITLSPGVLSIPALSALVEVVRVEADQPSADAEDARRDWRIGARIVTMR